MLLLLIFSDVKCDRENPEDKEIDANLVKTVGKVKDEYEHSITYCFYVGNLRYFANANGYHYDIGRFYKVEYSSLNPKYSRIFLDEEVTDSAAIANAGFRTKTMKEIMENDYRKVD